MSSRAGLAASPSRRSTSCSIATARSSSSPTCCSSRTPRLSIIRDQIWGAPDLVAEVLSQSTRHHDRGEKLGWYRQYGVRECWLIDLHDDSVTVVDFTASHAVSAIAKGVDTIRSTVLPDLDLSAFGLYL